MTISASNEREPGKNKGAYLIKVVADNLVDGVASSKSDKESCNFASNLTHVSSSSSSSSSSPFFSSFPLVSVASGTFGAVLKGISPDSSSDISSTGAIFVSELAQCRRAGRVNKAQILTRHIESGR